MLRRVILDKTYDDRIINKPNKLKLNKNSDNLPELDFEKNKLSLA
jgi:hypothetical protein